MKKHVLALVLSVAGWTVGCGVPDIEGRMTITQGVYGQLLGGCDTPGCSTRVLPDEEVAIFDAPVTTGPVTATPIDSTRSDGAGFYELEAPAGHYYIAWVDDGSSGRAINTQIGEIDVPTGIVRVDFTSGSGGGLWQER